MSDATPELKKSKIYKELVEENQRAKSAQLEDLEAFVNNINQQLKRKIH